MARLRQRVAADWRQNCGVAGWDLREDCIRGVPGGREAERVLIALRAAEVLVSTAIFRGELAALGPAPPQHLQPDMVRDTAGCARPPRGLDRHSTCDGSALFLDKPPPPNIKNKPQSASPNL